MSGSATSFGNKYLSTITQGWYNTSQMIGCEDEANISAAAVLGCMRRKSAEDILLASVRASAKIETGLPPPSNLYAGVTGIFGPTIDVSRASFASKCDSKLSFRDSHLRPSQQAFFSLVLGYHGLRKLHESCCKWKISPAAIYGRKQYRRRLLFRGEGTNTSRIRATAHRGHIHLSCEFCDSVPR